MEIKDSEGGGREYRFSLIVIYIFVENGRMGE